MPSKKHFIKKRQEMYLAKVPAHRVSWGPVGELTVGGAIPLLRFILGEIDASEVDHACAGAKEVTIDFGDKYFKKQKVLVADVEIMLDTTR